jgi:hypothetical protein
MLSGVQISDSAWGFKSTRPFPGSMCVSGKPRQAQSRGRHRVRWPVVESEGQASRRAADADEFVELSAKDAIADCVQTLA